MSDFINDPGFDAEKYQMYLRRIHYEERDAINYENMLSFLYDYVKKPGCIEEYQDLLEEYEHWNEMLIEKCFNHLPHDTPYVKARRAYQSVVCLLAGDYEKGEEELRAIGDAFASDQLPPKIIMTKNGTIYKQMSRLFLVYNYAKVYGKRKMAAELEKLKKSYPHAFRIYDDEEHEAHDAFYKSQMEEHEDVIFYPVFTRIYKVPGGEREFFVYFDESEAIEIDQILGGNEAENE